METIIENRPSNTIIRCQFSQGETLTSEGGSMVSMSSGLDIETTTKSRGKSGVASAAKRLLAGESFFLNHYTANEDQCELVLSP
ncbi:MAG: AIM24 family protein, partial [Rickettsiales bacterium]|nr:AIM24 family protein [Rickettsiales bacterium]